MDRRQEGGISGRGIAEEGWIGWRLAEQDSAVLGLPALHGAAWTISKCRFEYPIEQTGALLGARETYPLIQPASMMQWTQQRLDTAVTCSSAVSVQFRIGPFADCDFYLMIAKSSSYIVCLYGLNYSSEMGGKKPPERGDCICHNRQHLSRCILFVH